jgi:hypothetical protein
MQRAKVLVVGTGLLLSTRAAFAQGDGAGEGSGSAEIEITTGGTAGVGDLASPWPVAIIARPYNLPKSQVAAYGDIDIPHFKTSSTFTQGAFHLGGAYGVNEKLTAGGEYTFMFAGDGPDQAKYKGPLRAYGIYSLLRNAKMVVAAAADLEMNFAGKFNGGMPGVPLSAATTFALHAGLDARYLVAPKFAVFTGNPFGPGVSGGTGALFFPGFSQYSVGQHLSIGLNENQPISFAIPVGAALQATPQLYVYLDTTLANLYLSNGPRNANGQGSKSATLIGDDTQGIPVNIGALFSVNKNIDAGVNLFDDLRHAGDFYDIALIARWYK